LGINRNIHVVWKSFQSGNKEAFANIYNQNLNTLYRYGTKFCSNEEIVKDAIQEVFVDLYLKRERNKTNPENLKYYLILSLKRNLIKKIKKIRKSGKNILAKELLFEPEYNIEQVIIKSEEETEKKRLIELLLKELPVKQKEVLYLRFNEAMEYSDIAKVMNISVESVRKQVYRAIKTIRELFSN
jgi:RNA polymerase sigma factor (sigma-70 family)